MKLFNKDTQGLCDFICAQSEYPQMWRVRTDKPIVHHSSGVGIWLNHSWKHVDILDDYGGKQGVEFSIMQKWKIHRKLMKLKKRIEKSKKEEAAAQYLERMVRATLTGEKG